MAKINFPINLSNYSSIFTALSFFVVIIMAVIFFWPGFQELKMLQANLKDKRLELEMKEEYLVKLDKVKLELESLQEDFSKTESALPEDPSLPSLFNYLQKTSSESGLIFEEINPFSTSPSREVADLQETVFGIDLVGSYPSLKNFILKIEKSARLIEVENISFSFKKEEDFSTFSLRIRVFSY